MNYCMPDMYEMPHGVAGGFPVQGGRGGGGGGGEYCMHGGEGTSFGNCEPQRLHHHPPCMEQQWPPGPAYSCPYPRAGPQLPLPPRAWPHVQERVLQHGGAAQPLPPARLLQWRRSGRLLTDAVDTERLQERYGGEAGGCRGPLVLGLSLPECGGVKKCLTVLDILLGLVFLTV
ncbi:hypothetical protein AALO_G00083710 [Alosa alosa]|uniref:Uncharacterized protein n=1 Tax=Alosa alosa TaxID=278164 RepID=A0AAV6GXY6_9TELE|nr:hypothetical protein AALO_G00083710 [Alosa alosa]